MSPDPAAGAPMLQPPLKPRPAVRSTAMPMALAAAAACWGAWVQAAPAPGELPEGVWVGHITSRTIPDVDKDGEWEQQIRIEHCGGQALLAFRGDDEWYEPIALRVVPLNRQYLLTLFHEGGSESGRWIESQIWTLVDASPGRWTIAQSRAVLNPDMPVDAPWRTFRRLAWGSLDFDPDGCKPEREPGPAPTAEEPAPEAAASRPWRVARGLPPRLLSPLPSTRPSPLPSPLARPPVHEPPHRASTHAPSPSP